MKKKGLLILFSLVLFLVQILKVNAEDEREDEGIGISLGKISIILYIFALSTGIFIWILQQKPVLQFFKEKKIQVPIKYIWKIHHPLTFISFFCGLIHGISIQIDGEIEEGGSLGWMAIIIMTILMISGFLFNYFKGSKRNIIRFIHFGLMLTAGIFMAMHAITADD